MPLDDVDNKSKMSNHDFGMPSSVRWSKKTWSPVLIKALHLGASNYWILTEPIKSVRAFVSPNIDTQ